MLSSDTQKEPEWSHPRLIAKAVLEFAQRNNAQMLDVRFTDLPGLWHHVSFPISQLTWRPSRRALAWMAPRFAAGPPSTRATCSSIPDPSRYVLDPFTEVPTLVMVCDVIDPVTKQRYDRDPRYIAKKAEIYLASTGIADTAHFGAEAEFFIFDNIRFDQNEHEGYYFIDAEEGRWNSGRAEGNLGYRPRYKEGYFPVPPTDHYQDLRTEMVLAMQSCGLEVECHHHEVATGGQTEIDLRYDSLLRSADTMMIYKYVAKNVANQAGKTVTFMPKPLFQDNGSGMHTHQSLWKDGQPLFAGDGYAGLSQLALWYIGGLIKHGPALSAIIAPTTNSYKRLVPGFEAPVNLAYSRRNRSAAVRIPMYSASPKAKRVEFRPPDPSCNPYLAFAAMLMAGIDGIENRIEPGPSARQGHLRPRAGRTDQSPVDARLVGSRTRCALARLPVPDERRCIHRRAAQHLHRLQARERSGCSSLAPAPVRVSDVLRRVKLTLAA